MNNKGVTLIELLIVIIVIGIIAGFAIPAVTNVIEETEKQAVLQDALALEGSARTYCATNACPDGTTLTWADLTGANVAPAVFSSADYEETDGDATLGGPLLTYDATARTWTVILTADSGDYSFNGVPTDSTIAQVS